MNHITKIVIINKMKQDSITVTIFDNIQQLTRNIKQHSVKWSLDEELSYILSVSGT